MVPKSLPLPPPKCPDELHGENNFRFVKFVINCNLET